MNIKKRIILGAAVGTTVFGSVFGLAASLEVSSADNLGAGSADVTSCDLNGVSTVYTYSANFDAITSVTVNGIADDCDEAQLFVRMTDEFGDVSSAGTGTVQTVFNNESNSLTVALDEPADAELVSDVQVTLHGGTLPDPI